MQYDPYTSPLPHVDYGTHDPDRWESLDGFNDDHMTNGKRAASAEMYVNYPFEEQADYADLICNLLHLAHSRGEDPFDIYTSALNNFHEEAAPLS